MVRVYPYIQIFSNIILLPYICLSADDGPSEEVVSNSGTADKHAAAVFGGTLNLHIDL